MDKRIIDLICGSEGKIDTVIEPTTKEEIDEVIHNIYRKFLRLPE